MDSSDDSYHEQLRSLLGLDFNQTISIIPDNALTHQSTSPSSPPPDTPRRRRKSRHCIKNKSGRSKSPPGRWDAVKEYAPSMPPPRSLASYTTDAAVRMPLRKPVRMNSFGNEHDKDEAAILKTCLPLSPIKLLPRRKGQDTTPSCPHRFLADSKLFHAATEASKFAAFSGPAKSLEEIWQLLDELTGIPADGDDESQQRLLCKGVS